MSGDHNSERVSDDSEGVVGASGEAVLVDGRRAWGTRIVPMTTFYTTYESSMRALFNLAIAKALYCRGSKIGLPWSVLDHIT